MLPPIPSARLGRAAALVVLPVLAAAMPAAAQQAPIPPVRLIAAPTAASRVEFGAITTAIELPGRRLLLNDPVQRRLVLLDSALTSGVNVMDTVSGAASSYPRIAGLVPYLADSSLLVDGTTYSMLVIDPAGKIARVAAVPRSRDAAFLAMRPGGAGFDAKHRLVYGIPALPTRPPVSPSGAFAMPVIPDSAFIVAADLATRTIDTIASYKVPAPKVNVTQSDGRFSVTSEIDPLPVTDDWAVTTDGSVAIVRAQDVHIDWINADGTRSSTPKLPFEWRRLTDDDKAAVIDSTKAALDRARAGQPGGLTGSRQIVVMGRAGGGGGAPSDAPAPTTVSLPDPTIMSAAELPDYRPPFPAGGIKADLEGNLWILTSQVRPNAAVPGTIYDIVDRKGQLVDRVEIPAGRVIVGFGAGGVVYMAARGEKGAWIERTHR